MESKNNTSLFEVKKVDLIPTKKRASSHKNVLKRMEDHGAKGPMSILYRCVENRLKAKVWTRGSCHIRGICTGFIVAFDKHCNLAMVDVDEIYMNPLYNNKMNGNQNKKASKSISPKSTPNNFPTPNNDDEDTDTLNIAQRDLNTFHKQTENNTKKVESVGVEKYLIRHVPQILLRGDNVVLIAINE